MSVNANVRFELLPTYVSNEEETEYLLYYCRLDEREFIRINLSIGTFNELQEILNYYQEVIKMLNELSNNSIEKFMKEINKLIY